MGGFLVECEVFLLMGKECVVVLREVGFEVVEVVVDCDLV